MREKLENTVIVKRSKYYYENSLFINRRVYFESSADY